MKKIFAILVALSAISMIIGGCAPKEEATTDTTTTPTTDTTTTE